MKADQWQIDLDSQTAVHKSGFTVHVDGNPRMPFSVSPTNVPEGCNVIEQASLLREALQVMINTSDPSGFDDYSYSAAKPEKKCKIVNKPVFVPPANKPDRPVLSLKRAKATPEVV